MAVKSGFFNSVSGDRKYDADDVNELFDGVINEGVFSSLGNALVVGAGSGLQVTIDTGRAWFLKSWLTNTSVAYRSLSAADLTYDRIDIVALDFDKSNSIRDNDIIIVEGTPASSPVAPTLIDDTDHIQIPLAHVLVEANETQIVAGDITNKIGTVDCPFVTGLVDQIEITDLLAQWDYEFDQWMIGIEADLDAIDTDAVLSELSDMRDQPHVFKNLIVNGDMRVSQRGTTPVSGKIDEIPSYIGQLEIIDRWRVEGYGLTTGEWTFSKEDATNGRKSMKAIMTTGQGACPASSVALISYPIEAYMCQAIRMGTTDAKELTLSFNFKTNVTGTYIVELMQYYGTALCIGAAFTVSVSDVWVGYEITFPEETTNLMDYDNGSGLVLSFCVAAGSDYTSGGSLQDTWGAITTNKRFYGQVNMSENTGNYIEITDVQLELGPNATEFERISYVDNLNYCRRYLEYQATYMLIGYAQDTDNLYIYGPRYSVRKRDNPDWYFSAVAVLGQSWSFGSITSVGVTPTGIDNKNFPSFKLPVTGSVLTAGNFYQLYFTDLLIEDEIPGGVA